MPDLVRPHDVSELTAGELDRARRGDIVNLTPAQLDRIARLSDQWSFLWDKRRSLWIAAEDCPDGEQIEDTNLDVLLAQLPAGHRLSELSSTTRVP
jgi:hypothetical protein